MNLSFLFFAVQIVSLPLFVSGSFLFAWKFIENVCSVYIKIPIDEPVGYIDYPVSPKQGVGTLWLLFWMFLTIFSFTICVRISMKINAAADRAFRVMTNANKP